MNKLDKNLITRKAKLIKEDLQLLEKYQEIGTEKFVEDYTIQLQVERLLEKVVSRLIDINYHVLRQEFAKMPKDYYQSFIMMGEVGVVSKKLADKVAEAAGLRNVLAHEYDKIIPQKVYDAIPLALNQVPQYIKRVLEYFD